jgi:hypothetical protein
MEVAQSFCHQADFAVADEAMSSWNNAGDLTHGPVQNISSAPSF